MGVDDQRTFAACVQTICPKGLGEFDHAKATAISLLRVSALAHNHVHEDFDIWANPCGLLADAFGRPIDPEAMMCRHVIAVGRMLVIARSFDVRGDPFSF